MIVLLDHDGLEVVAYDDAARAPTILSYDGRQFELEDIDGDDYIYREVVS